MNSSSKPGFKSTEFWITCVGVVGGLIMAAIPESPWANIVGGILAAVCGSSYSVGRSLVKGNQEKGAALIEAAKVAAGKKPSA